LKNHADVEDVFQDVFLKYLVYQGSFDNDVHEKAWFIRVAINGCKDTLKSFFRKNTVPLDELYHEPVVLDEEESEVLRAVLKLPANYRDVIYLHYYEGYSAVEIASILEKKENTIYTWLARGRKKLKIHFGGESIER
jgi:RNA polymerase sigma-70 factor (ECF subfamily)